MMGITNKVQILGCKDNVPKLLDIKSVFKNGRGMKKCKGMS